MISQVFCSCFTLLAPHFFSPGLKSCVSDGAVLRRFFTRGMNGYSAPAERAGGLKVGALLGVMKNLAGLQGGTPQL